MIIFNLIIDLAKLDTRRSADNLMQEIANILQVGKSDLVLSSIPWSISEYRLGIETEGAFKYTLHDILEPVELADGTKICKRKFLRFIRKVSKKAGAKLTHNSRRLRVTITRGE